jgi:membrane dipeptidase
VAYSHRFDWRFYVRGRDLHEISRLKLIPDVTHLSDDCFWKRLNLTARWRASFTRAAHLCRTSASLTSKTARSSYDAVIGLALDAWMIVPGWVRGQTTLSLVSRSPC